MAHELPTDVTVKRQTKLDLSEIGSTGLNVQAGHIFEEKLKQLDGPRGRLVFMEMRDNDATIGAIQFVIDKLIREVEWNIEPFSKDAGDVAAAEFLKTCMTDMDQPWDEVISEIMSMLTFGFAPLEQVFKRRQGFQGFQLAKPMEKRIPNSRFNDGMIGWKRLPLRAQETVTRWRITDHGDIEGLIQQAPPMMNEVFIPIEKLLLMRTSTHKNNPEGRSSLRNAFRPWFFKKKIENLEGIGVERDLAGLPIAFVPPEILSQTAGPQEKQIRQQIERIVTNVRRDEQEGIVFPMVRDELGHMLYDFKLLSTAGARQFKTNEIINRYKQDIATTVVADFILLGHEKVGSFALASSKTTIFSMAIRAWLKMIANVLNRKAVPMLWTLNGLDLNRLPRFAFGDVETVDLTELGNYINSLTNAGVDLSSDKVGNYLKQQASIPLEEQE